MPAREPDAPDEDALIRRFQAGDEAAYQLLVERYKAMLAGRIEQRLPHRLRRRMSVADVVQESLLAAYDHRADLQSDSEKVFRSWLLTIAERKVHEVVRRHEDAAKRDQRREVTRSRRRATAAFPGRRTSPSQAAVGAEVEALAQAALARLPPDYREVLRLAQHEQLGLVEVAERMGRSHAAVRQLYGRALTRFRAEFLKEGGSQP